MTDEYSYADIMHMDKRFRTTFVNCLSGFKSAFLLGTQSQAGETNLAVMSSVTHVGANPPLLGLLFRPDLVPRHSLENILETGVYTLSHVSRDLYQQAHQSSARYGRSFSEFTELGLDAAYHHGFAAPYVAQSKLSLGLSFQEQVTVQSNGTIFVIGKIEYVLLEPAALADDGYVDAASLDSIAVLGLDAYHQVTAIERLPYAHAPSDKRD